MSVVDVLCWMLVAVFVIPAHARAWKSRGELAAVVALDVVIIGLVVIGASWERTWSRLAREDGPIEWATVAAFFGAAVLHGLKLRGGAGIERLMRGAIFLFCVFVAGEELSWGQRIFAFKPPDAFLEKNFQQEMNLHNVLMDEGGLGFALESKHLVVAIALLFAIALPLLVRVFTSAKSLAPSWSFLPAALAIAAAELTYPVDLTGEAAEMVLGLLLLACVLVEGPSPSSSSPSSSPVRVVAVLAGVLAMGAALAPMTARVLYGDDEAGRAVAARELEVLRDEVRQGMTEKLAKKKSIHKRVFTAVRDGYVKIEGRSREDRQGWFLDPWNNPYWILWNREQKRGLLYSFGPNRQRDTDVKESDTAAGDDVLLSF